MPPPKFKPDAKFAKQGATAIGMGIVVSLLPSDLPSRYSPFDRADDLSSDSILRRTSVWFFNGEFSSCGYHGTVPSGREIFGGNIRRQSEFGLLL